MEDNLSKQNSKVLDLIGSIENFRRFFQGLTPFPDFKAHFKIAICDHIIYRGKDYNPSEKLKTFIYLPGTAFLSYSTFLFDNFASGLITFLKDDYQIILPFYPYAPEDKFPAAIQHLQRSLKKLLNNCAQHQIDRQKIIFGGFSSGAVLTIPLSIYFSKRNIHFKGIMLIAPICDFSGQTHKSLNYNHSYVDFINQHYSNSNADLYDPRYSPIYTKNEDLSLLKNFTLIYGEFDFMRRTIEAFKERLVESGVKLREELLKDQGHGICTLARLTSIEMSEQKLDALRKKKLQGLKKIAQCLDQMIQS